MAPTRRLKPKKAPPPATLLRQEAQIPALWLSAALFLLFGKSWLAAAATAVAPAQAQQTVDVGAVLRYTVTLNNPAATPQTFALTLGANGHRCSVAKDDFQATWRETEVVSADPTYRTNYGKVHYFQHLVRDHPLIMRPGHVYRLAVNFEPDVARIG